MLWLVGLCFCIAGCAEAAMEHLQFHYKGGNPFFNKDSWKLKYKNNDPKQGPKFLFSTTLLVWLTDGWHLFKFIRTTFIFLGIGLLSMKVTLALLFLFVFKISFTILFNYLKR